MELPFDRFLNLTYHFATDGAEEKERDKFDVRLNMPMPGARPGKTRIDSSSPWSPERESSALGGLAAAVGMG